MPSVVREKGITETGPTMQLSNHAEEPQEPEQPE